MWETTIDLNMQIAAETALEQVILELREEGLGQKHEGQDAEGGAVVAIDVKTGQVLACASYPTFHLATYSQDFNELREAELDPLYNRALQATYAPGSVFKMAVTIAAINQGRFPRLPPLRTKASTPNMRKRAIPPPVSHLHQLPADTWRSQCGRGPGGVLQLFLL